MSTHRPLGMPITLGLLLALTPSIQAQLPDNYVQRWDSPAVQQRIDDGIERNRKNDALVTIVDATGQGVSNATITVTQQSHEFLFGCNLFVLGQMKEKEQAYEDAFVHLFNFATVAFYWDDLEPVDGQARFAEGSPVIWRRPPPDRAVAFGKKHGLTLKGHPLVWHNRAHNPAWMPKDPTELRQRYVQRFREIAQRYARDIPIWDGVNESLVCQEDFPLYSAASRDYPPHVPWAFREQQKLFQPDNLLMINDVTTFNWPSTAANKYYQQCRRLLDEKVPIEGIGFQFHFFNRQSLDGYLNGDRCDPNTMLDTYERFATFGLPLWVTEITIGSAGQDGLAVQERVVRDIYRLWFSAPKMAGITWWNLGDGTAYGNEGVAGGGLADEQFQRKPAYQALDQLINHQWKTSLTLRSDANGKAQFRGFKGQYVIKVTHGDKSQSANMTLTSGEPAKVVLALP